MPLALKLHEIGEDCIEVALTGNAGPPVGDHLEAAFAAAVKCHRHILLNLGACDYLAPAVVAAIDDGTQRLANQGLDVLPYAASEIVRALLDGEREIQSPTRPSGRRLGAFSPRPPSAN